MRKPEQIEQADGGKPIRCWYDSARSNWDPAIVEARQALDPDGEGIAIIAFPLPGEKGRGKRVTEGIEKASRRKSWRSSINL